MCDIQHGVRTVGRSEKEPAADSVALKHLAPRAGDSLFAVYILHPRYAAVHRWNLFIGALLLVEAPLLPWQLAFVQDDDLKHFPWLLWFNCWADTAFWLDLLLQFMLQAQTRDKSHWTADVKEVAVKYFKSLFFIDLVAVAPLKRFVLQALNRGDSCLSDRESAFLVENNFAPGSCLLALIGFHRLLRFARVPRVVHAMHMDGSPVAAYTRLTFRPWTLLKSCTIVLFGAHVMGCLWASLAVCSTSEGIYSWYQFLDGEKGVHKESIDTSTNIYLCALYWAVYTLTGIGYGDIVPVTPLEYIVSLVCMVVGSLMWAWVVANIVSIMATMNQAANEHLQTIDCINELIRDSEVRKFGHRAQFGRRLREYFTRMRNVNAHDFAGQLVADLSPKLRIEVVFAVHGTWIDKIWWLRKLDHTDFVVELTQCMIASLHTPGELIPSRPDLCIIRHGLCMHGGHMLTRDHVFGEDMLLSSEALRKNYVTLVLTFLHLLVISNFSFMHILGNYPEVQPHMRKAQVIYVVMRGLRQKAAELRKEGRVLEAVPEEVQPNDVPLAHGSESSSKEPSHMCHLGSATTIGFTTTGDLIALRTRVDETEERLRSRVERMESAADRLTEQARLLRTLVM